MAAAEFMTTKPMHSGKSAKPTLKNGHASYFILSVTNTHTHTHNLGWSYLLFSDVCLRHRDHQSGPGCSDPRLASHFRFTKGPLLPSAGAKPLGELNFWLGKAARGIADLGSCCAGSEKQTPATARWFGLALSRIMS